MTDTKSLEEQMEKSYQKLRDTKLAVLLDKDAFHVRCIDGKYKLCIGQWHNVCTIPCTVINTKEQEGQR